MRVYPQKEVCTQKSYQSAGACVLVKAVGTLSSSLILSPSGCHDDGCLAEDLSLSFVAQLTKIDHIQTNHLKHK